MQRMTDIESGTKIFNRYIIVFECVAHHLGIVFDSLKQRPVGIIFSTYFETPMNNFLASGCRSITL